LYRPGFKNDKGFSYAGLERALTEIVGELAKIEEGK